MNFKKKLQIFAMLFIFCSFNYSVKSYSKKKLEDFHTWVAISEMMTSMPFIFSDNPTQNEFYLSAPSMLLERFCSLALEDYSLISIATSIAKVLKLCANPEFSKKIGKSKPNYLFLECALISAAYSTIMRIYPEKKNRIKRRVYRMIARSLVEVVFDLIVEFGDRGYTIKDGEVISDVANIFWRFCCALVFNGVSEYIGEKMIQGTKKK